MKKGFTLIELLVVVLIIGILAAVALPQYTKAVERSRTAEAIQRMGDLATALQIAYMQNGSFPGSADTEFGNMDLTFGTLNTNSYNVAVTGGNNAALISAGRNGGQYKDGVLWLKVDGNGSITKGCKEGTNAGLCGLTTSAGYSTNATIPSVS